MSNSSTYGTAERCGAIIRRPIKSEDEAALVGGLCGLFGNLKETESLEHIEKSPAFDAGMRLYGRQLHPRHAVVIVDLPATITIRPIPIVFVGIFRRLLQLVFGYIYLIAVKVFVVRQ